MRANAIALASLVIVPWYTGAYARAHNADVANFPACCAHDDQRFHVPTIETSFPTIHTAFLTVPNPPAIRQSGRNIILAGGASGGATVSGESYISSTAANIGSSPIARFIYTAAIESLKKLLLGKATLLINLLKVDAEIQKTNAIVTKRQEDQLIELFAEELMDTPVTEVVKELRATNYLPGNFTDAELAQRLLDSAKKKGISVQAN